MELVTHNAFAELRSAPAWFLNLCARHLSVPVPLGTRKGHRFGLMWFYEGQTYGSLVNGHRVPAGLVPHVRRLAAHYQVPVSLRDARRRPEENLPWWMVHADWRPYQNDVQRTLVQHSRGVIDAPPRSGKTLMAARIIDSLALPAVYIAPSVQIVRQTYEVLLEFYGDNYVSRLDGSAKSHQKDPSKSIVVTTPASAVALPREWWDTRDVMILDEFHHAAAETYHKINALAANVFYRYGFTGTHFRTGDDALAMEAICSAKLFKIPIDYLVGNGYLAMPRVFFVNHSAPRCRKDGWDAAYLDGIVRSEERNARVVEVTESLLAQGVPSIVLTRRRAHADALGEAIDGAVVVKGGENVLTSAAVREFRAGSIPCLVGTTVIGEGVDVPLAGALVYASGGAAGVATLQSYYRPLTARDGKTHGRIYDFWDRHHPILNRHSESRFAMSQDNFGSTRVHSFEG